jgi:hypothetical protein
MGEKVRLGETSLTLKPSKPPSMEGDEKKGKEVAELDVRDQVLTDAPPVPSTSKQKEEEPTPTAPLEESQERKKLQKYMKKKKKWKAKQEAKRLASTTARNLQKALVAVGQTLESQTEPPLPSE